VKSLIDIHVVLSTAEDFEDWEEQSEQASERFNEILFMLYEVADEDIPVNRFEKMVEHLWQVWSTDPYLLEVEYVDLMDWVDHLLTNWDDGET
jgi:seryl-tRNA synthetase